mmetsp:Transcript_32603/g.76135  ORF Transcript_32603/g.76135 Transcript_32603/m.76135 type:complete len:274 (+) Transcript_32603:217-1038(+)
MPSPRKSQKCVRTQGVYLSSSRPQSPPPSQFDLDIQCRSLTACSVAVVLESPLVSQRFVLEGLSVAQLDCIFAYEANIIQQRLALMLHQIILMVSVNVPTYPREVSRTPVSLCPADQIIFGELVGREIILQLDAVSSPHRSVAHRIHDLSILILLNLGFASLFPEPCQCFVHLHRRGSASAALETLCYLWVRKIWKIQVLLLSQIHAFRTGHHSHQHNQQEHQPERDHHVSSLHPCLTQKPNAILLSSLLWFRLVSLGASVKLGSSLAQLEKK